MWLPHPITGVWPARRAEALDALCPCCTCGARQVPPYIAERWKRACGQGAQGADEDMDEEGSSSTLGKITIANLPDVSAAAADPMHMSRGAGVATASPPGAGTQQKAAGQCAAPLRSSMGNSQWSSQRPLSAPVLTPVGLLVTHGMCPQCKSKNAAGQVGHDAGTPRCALFPQPCSCCQLNGSHLHRQAAPAALITLSEHRTAARYTDRRHCQTSPLP
jgi:hypothetical protein